MSAREGNRDGEETSGVRASPTSDGLSHWAFGRGLCITLCWKACLMRNERSYSSRVVSRPSA
jgi:hypothetical protein